MNFEENINEVVATDMTNKDLLMLFEGMQKLGEGFFEELDVSEFDNKEIANRFNSMLDGIVKRGNHFLSRINDAQSRIGDISILKAMLEQIGKQQEVIDRLQMSRNNLENKSDSTEEVNKEFLSLAEMLRGSYLPCIEELEKALVLMDSVLSDKEETAGAISFVSEDLGRLKESEQLLNQMLTVLKGIGRRVYDMTDRARRLYSVIDKEAKINDAFLNNVDVLTDSYKMLSGECLDMGRYLVRISRDIDNARNDMYRHNSKPTLHDTLRVYEVDHLTLAWRLYNNLVEFESLRLTQVNNNTGCKFALWCKTVEDPIILEAESFRLLVKAHDDLHIACTDCFLAKQNYDTKAGLKMFDVVMKKLKDFLDASEAFHEFLRSINITQETDVWKFRG